AEAATKIAAITEVALLDIARETRIALTPASAFEIPTATPTTSPGPTATWTTGWGGCDVWYSTTKPDYMSCWSGTYDNGFVFLEAGNEGREGDINQGVLYVVFYDVNQVMRSDHLYYTPQVLGPIRIVAVSGSLVTVAPTDPQWAQVRFVFDLTTSQWLPASPVPVGSPSPAGSPSSPP
ncbi:MAG TPA: hypothetical protein VKY74_21095, partial [Chloroflexia bacterium]|nr:hypothetical protein [Chloroflexia bacterium]